MKFIKNPVKKIVVGFVATRLLRRVAPKLIPGGLAAVLATEAVKYYFNHKESESANPSKIPQAQKPTKKPSKKASSKKGK